MAKKTDYGYGLEELPEEIIAPNGQKIMNSAPGAVNMPAGIDVTTQKQATSKKSVDKQDAATRLWQSLSTTYGARTRESDKQYDLNRNAADRAAIQRGMGRSSYNLATMANINNEKAEAADRIQQELIADYQNRLNDLDNQEFQREQFQYQKDSDQKQIAIQYINNMLQNGGTPSDDLLKQAGLSRKDYDQMKKKQQVRYAPKKPTTESDPSKGAGANGIMTWEDYLKMMNQGKPTGRLAIKSVDILK